MLGEDERAIGIADFLHVPLVGAGEEAGAVGSPRQPSEPGVGRREPDLGVEPARSRVDQEDARLVQDGEKFAVRVHGQVARPAVEGDRPSFDPLAGRDQERPVGLPAHPEDRPTRQPQPGQHDDQHGRPGKPLPSAISRH